MATNTYVALAQQTLTSAVPSVTFSGIDQGYTDVIVVFTGSFSANSDWLAVQVNGDTENNYSYTQVTSAGTLSYRGGSLPFMVNGGHASSNSTQLNAIMQFQNYSNSTTYKTMLSRYNDTSSNATAAINLWNNTNAISSIRMYCTTAGNFNIGSTFSLYGIKAQVTPGTAQATGGTISYDAFGYVYHTFTSGGTFTPSVDLTCDYAVVAGGGGAGGVRSTFGTTGGGGSLESPITLSPGGYSITVGGPGAGATGTYAAGTQGNNSTFSSIISTGGGGGGTSSAYATIGGSGGAGGMRLSGLAGLGAAGTAGQGFAGGNASSSGGYSGGGGGGAGAIGGTAANNNPSNAGAGGNGVTLYVGGSALSLAGGGGGGSEGGGTFWGAGGLGGGGNGNSSAGQGGTGTVNTGSGGGGGGNDSGTGGAGGSGLVIIRYQG